MSKKFSVQSEVLRNIMAGFINKDNFVVGLVERIKPFQLSSIFFKASYAIEIAAGIIAETKTSVGDKIEWIEDRNGPNIPPI